jgi:hypothetical protein
MPIWRCRKFRREEMVNPELRSVMRPRPAGRPVGGEHLRARLNVEFVVVVKPIQQYAHQLAAWIRRTEIVPVDHRELSSTVVRRTFARMQVPVAEDHRVGYRPARPAK